MLAPCAEYFLDGKESKETILETLLTEISDANANSISYFFKDEYTLLGPKTGTGNTHLQTHFSHLNRDINKDDNDEKEQSGVDKVKKIIINNKISKLNLVLKDVLINFAELNK